MPDDEKRIDPWAVLAWSLTVITWAAGIPASLLAWTALTS